MVARAKVAVRDLGILNIYSLLGFRACVHLRFFFRKHPLFFAFPIAFSSTPIHSLPPILFCVYAQNDLALEAEKAHLNMRSERAIH